MILDASKIALLNGHEKAAVDVLPGAVVRSSGYAGDHTRVVKRDIREGEDILCLCLSSGRKLCVSMDQKVGRVTPKPGFSWTVASDILPGDHLRGNVDGVTITVTVDGILFYPKHPVRLVNLITDQNRSFIAEGVACR